jgi:hypothetical protein
LARTDLAASIKGLTTKQFLPNIKERLKKRIQLTPNLTAVVTAHGRTKAYLQRFKIIDSAECPCGTGNQTVEHLMYECTKVQRERGPTRHLAEGKKLTYE